MVRRLSLTVVLLVVAVNVFAAERHIVFFRGAIPASFDATVAQLGGSVEAREEEGLALVTGLDADEADRLERSQHVFDVVPDVPIDVRPGTPTVVQEGEEEPPAISSFMFGPQSAAYYPLQWHLRAIGAEGAWDSGRFGSSRVSVAVVDTGIDYTHADLDGRVDLDRSISFVGADSSIIASLFPGMHPVADLHLHGTHVAATISSNAMVAAGVTSQTTLFGVKVADRFGHANLGDILRGIMYAARSGADVINVSLGGYFSKPTNGIYVAGINHVMSIANRHGSVVVVAAGNEAHDMDHNGNLEVTFCAAPNVVCVSATGPLSGGQLGPWTGVDTPTSYTNFGRSAISVAAPGGNGAGPVWAACSRTSLVLPVCQSGNYIAGSEGTSMAAPHVSGLAALLVAELGPGKPSQIKARIQQSADDLGQPGTDPFFGRGRINVSRALGIQ
jgi:subtilisin family serine protease